MLPVQTVMIRYMVLVYRWGRGWLGAAGDWGGAWGGAVTGGCARRVLQLPYPDAKRPRRRGVGGAFSLREGRIHSIKNYILHIKWGCGFDFNSVFLIFLIPGIRVKKYTALGDSE